MEIEKIGIIAGKIWEYIDKSGEVTVLKIKTNLHLSNSLVCMGIGWLAREDKINIKASNRDYKILLKSN